MSKNPSHSSDSTKALDESENCEVIDRSSLAFTRSEMFRVYRLLAEKVSRRERSIAKELPIETPYGLDALLERVITDWQIGRKSFRTVPVMNAYDAVIAGPITDEVERLLVGLDAHINVLDDIIDTPAPTHDTRIHYAFNATISNRLLWEAVPSNRAADIGELLDDYFVTIFQIPAVEGQLLDRFKLRSSGDERIEIGRQLYAYRARAMTAFAELPAVVLGVDSSVADWIVDDLVAFRARQLLFKDIRDIERDIRDGDETVLLCALREHRDPNPVANLVEGIREEFVYSASGDEAYGGALRALEGRPADLKKALAEQSTNIERGNLP